MIPSLPQDIQGELEQLALRYGQPLIHNADLHTTTLFDPLSKSDRYGEVCMVIRRPNGRLLTMIKTFYPPEAYRLMTGGINHGERILDALLRETYEETGLEVQITRFLAAVAYYVPNIEGKDRAPGFYTFAFLLDETGGTLGVIDEGERVEAFKEIVPDALPGLAQHLEQLQNNYSDEIAGDWAHWGQFRAVIHRVVYDALSSSAPVDPSIQMS